MILAIQQNLTARRQLLSGADWSKIPGGPCRSLGSAAWPRTRDDCGSLLVLLSYSRPDPKTLMRGGRKPTLLSILLHPITSYYILLHPIATLSPVLAYSATSCYILSPSSGAAAVTPPLARLLSMFINTDQYLSISIGVYRCCPVGLFAPFVV
jgi:hypothetical protein